LRSCTRSSRSTFAPTRSSAHGDQLPRARRHRLLLHPDLRGQRTPGNLARIPNIHLGFGQRTFFGQSIGDLNLMIWLSFVLLVVAWFVLFPHDDRLRLRAVGEHPRAADTVGISVYKTR